MTDHPPSAPRRVLIVKPSALGDVVTALPVLRGLRRSYPDAHIAWLVRDIFAGVLAGDADLDEVLIYDRRLLGRFWRPGAGMAHARHLADRLRTGAFDWAIDLQGLLRSGLFVRATRAPVRAGFADAREGAARFYTHRFDLPVAQHHTVERNIRLARLLGVDARAEDMTLTPTPAGQRTAGALLDRYGLGHKGFLACLPPTTWATKCYPVRHWRTVLGELSRDLPVAVLGGGSDRPLCAEVTDGLGDGVHDLCGQTDIPALVAVLHAAAGVLCCDSAAKFIGQAVGTDVTVLTGPTLAERTGPYPLVSPPGRVVRADVGCRGCLRKQCAHGTCMELIAPSDVVRTVREMLSGGAG